MFECEIVEIENQKDDCLKANKLLWDALPICDDGVKFINVEKQPFKIVLNESNCDESRYTIYTDKLFDGPVVSVKSCKLIGLAQVILQIDKEHLSKITSMEVSNLKKSLSQTVTIIKQSKSLAISIKHKKKSINIHTKIISCSPVSQGLITKDTDIIISSSLSSNSITSINQEEPEKSFDLTSIIDSLFLTSINDENEPKSIKLTSRMLESQPNVDIPKGIDPECVIYVSFDILFKLAIFNGSWVLSSSSNCINRRPCIVFAVDFITDDSVYIPPQLFHNLKSPENLLLSTCSSSSPYTASNLTLSRIASPLTVSTVENYEKCMQALSKWFKQCNRVLSKDDLLGIPVEDDGVVFFKVDELVDGVFMVDPMVTKLLQKGVSYNLIPNGFSRYFGINPPYPPFSTLHQKLTPLLKSSLHPFYQSTNIPFTILLSSIPGTGKTNLINYIANALGFSIIQVDCVRLMGCSSDDSKTKIQDELEDRFRVASDCGPCIVYLRYVDAFCGEGGIDEPGMTSVLQELINEYSKKCRESCSGFPLIVIATTNMIDKITEGMRSCFNHSFILDSPSEKERNTILQNLLKNTNLAMDVSISHISMQTAALVAKDLRDLVGLTGLNAIKRISKVMSKQQGINQQDLVNAGVSLTAEDFEVSLNKTRMKLADSIGAPKIPKVTWEDIGGLSKVKNDILDTIQLPLEHPELFSSGMKKRSGILLYGPPGTGKTLIAKAIATSFSLNFLSVKGPELLNMYIGESESNVRKIFQKARNARPCVIFFDELDSVAPKRGEKGDSGGVMDRIVSQMLAELDGISSDEVFVIGATNRPDLLDSALLRPGRFDKLLYLGVSESHEMQMRILEALTRRFNLSPNLDLKTISELCPFNYTGADFYALCSDAMLKAMVRTIKFVDKKIEELPPDPNHPVKITPQYYLEQIHPEPIKVQVEHEDFVNALNELVPSVSMDDLNHYKQVREKFESKKESI